MLTLEELDSLLVPVLRENVWAGSWGPIQLEIIEVRTGVEYVGTIFVQGTLLYYQTGFLDTRRRVLDAMMLILGRLDCKAFLEVGKFLQSGGPLPKPPLPALARVSGEGDVC
jgi:hypothetical protein